ncbi:MAG: DUF5313 family protein [Actinomycetota bacterium]
MGERLRYYLGFRLPVKYREWVKADLASSSFIWRDAFLRVGVVLVTGFVIAASSGRWATFIGMSLGALIAFPLLLALGGWQRRRNLRRHRLYWGIAGEMGREGSAAEDGLDPMQRFYRRRAFDREDAR